MMKNSISAMWSIMNLFFGGPPEESLKRQVGKKASGPDVNEKTGSKHNEKYEQDITALKEEVRKLFYNRTLYQDYTEGSTRYDAT